MKEILAQHEASEAAAQVTCAVTMEADPMAECEAS